MKSIFAIALALVSALAIKVTSPDQNTIWSSGTAQQSIQWQAVSTDPTEFTVQLVNQAGFLTNSPVTLIQDQSTGSPNVVNSAQVSYPSGTWPAGTAFQINFVTTSNGQNAILAQSGMFNITNSGTVSMSSVSSSTSKSATSTTSASTTTVSASRVSGSTSASGAAGASGDAYGGIPNASASATKSGAANMLSASPIMAGAGFFGFILSLL